MQQLSIYYLSVLILQLYGFDGILELVKLIIVEILYTETESAFEAYVFYILFLLRWILPSLMIKGLFTKRENGQKPLPKNL